MACANITKKQQGILSWFGYKDFKSLTAIGVTDRNQAQNLIDQEIISRIFDGSLRMKGRTDEVETDFRVNACNIMQVGF